MYVASVDVAVFEVDLVYLILVDVALVFVVLVAVSLAYVVVPVGVSLVYGVVLVDVSLVDAAFAVAFFALLETSTFWVLYMYIDFKGCTDACKHQVNLLL